MCLPNLNSVAVDIPETWTKFQNLKVGQGDLDYDPFDILLCCFLQSFYMLNLELIALAVQEIFTGVRKFKI